MKKQIVLSAKSLITGYSLKGKTKIIHSDLNFEIPQGQFVAIVGKNGCGKSTLLKTLAGFIPSLEGEIFIEGISSNTIDVENRARKISVVLTEAVQSGNLKVREVVEVGRYPYSSWFKANSAEDEEIISKAIADVGLEGFEERKIETLSDGELQRVMIAKALCQQTEIILLDEPTSHLDLDNRFTIINLLKKIAHEEKKVVIFSTHEIELAIQSVDNLWLTDSSGLVHIGSPEDLILNNTVSDIFGHSHVEFNKDTGRFVYNFYSKAEINLQGEKDELYFWTENALKRIGYSITNESAKNTLIIHKNPNRWELQLDNNAHIFKSIEELTGFLSSLENH